MSTSRRDLLKGALAVGGAAGLATTLGLPWHAAANSVPTDPDRHFVFVYFFGGWDVLLAMDPRDPDQFNDDTLPTTGIQPAYSELQDDALGDQPLIETAVPGMVFGPYIGNLARHAEKMTVIRGMAMDSVAHIVGQRHANTGREPAGSSVRGSSLSTYFAALLGQGQAIPNLAGDIESFNLTHPLWASGISVKSIEDLRDALGAGNPSLTRAEKMALESFFAEQQRNTLSQWHSMALSNRAAAAAIVDGNFSVHFDISRNDAEMLALRDRFGLEDGTTGNGGPLALMAAQALTQGLSRCVTIRATNGLDAHDGANWSRDHGPRQRSGFNAVAALVDYLEATPYPNGGNWLDHTTIVIQSEFCRTPALNSSGGRDHHITNSCALLGAGIQGGQVIGQSSDYKLGAMAIDFETGELDPTGSFIHNHNIARTLFKSIGIEDDIADLRAEAIPAILRR